MSETNTYPLVTFALLAYNQENFVKDAIEGALNQNYKNLEIIISDDKSSDKTFEIIQNAARNYVGPHSITINRNDINFGLTSHFNKILSMAKGEIVVIGAGDDISLPARVADTVEIFKSSNEANFVSFTDIVISKTGEILRQPRKEFAEVRTNVTLDKFLSGQTPFLSGASRAYKKTALEFFGPLNIMCPSEDSPSLLRCLMLGSGIVSGTAGIMYRIHDANLSSAASMSTMDYEQIKAQKITDAHFSHNNGKIPIDTLFAIEEWAEKDFQRWQIRKKIDIGVKFKHNPKLLVDLVLSKHFTVREKLKLSKLML